MHYLGEIIDTAKANIAEHQGEQHEEQAQEQEEQEQEQEAEEGHPIETNEENEDAETAEDDMEGGMKDLSKTTPINYYSAKGDLKMCRYLIGRGAHCNKPDSYGNTPMYWAAYNGHLEICKLLYLNGGAQEDIRTLETFGGAPLRSTTSAAQPPKWYREKYRS